MPTLTQALNERIAVEGVPKTPAEIAKEERNQKDNDTFHRLDRLLMNEDFRWFHDTYLKSYVDIENKESEARLALNIRKSPEDRNNHAQRADMAQEIVSLLEREWKRLKTSIETRK